MPKMDEAQVKKMIEEHFSSFEEKLQEKIDEAVAEAVASLAGGDSKEDAE